MTSSRRWSVALASVLVIAGRGLELNREVAMSAPVIAASRSLPGGRVSIQADVTGLFVTVQADGTMKPASATVGLAEQFDLYDLGKGLFALKSLANGKYVSAPAAGPLVARSDSIAAAETFRRLGAQRSLVRLRAVAPNAFVCADQAGLGGITASRRCPQPWQLLRVRAVQTPPPPTFTITSPAPGSVLRTTTVTFRWDRAGDEFWLNVGTMPGTADVYESGSLGPATEHTATGLPLDGAIVYVQVRRRVGTLVETLTVEYTAAIRRGLAVITDFADRRLEDWSGAGMRTVDDVSVQLRRMEDHWAWVSHGDEKFQWDIIRIRLPQPAVADAYPNWGEFRDAAAAIIRQQVHTADYDVNSDDVIDAAWLIVSSGLETVPFAIGGASRNAGVNMFVDGQASGSVVVGATGNFNHELGHLLGLPDMYGTFSTMSQLTFMSDSWALPPQDLTAYERGKLGWLQPDVIRATTRGVWLPSATESFAAVMIPSPHAAEYFLIEYRNPPATGFGSVGQDYKGLAVYHVLEGSSMEQDPPLVKLEPADGSIQPNQPLDPNDFVFPENTALLRPMVLRSYYGDAEEVFRISNVAWRNGGLAFDVTIAPPPPNQPSPNLLTNASFEAGSDGPDGWTRGSYVADDATFVWPSATASDGTRSASLESSSGNDLWWGQTVTTLTQGERYRLCGALKGEGVQGVQGTVGANVSVLGGFVLSEPLSGSFDWTTSCVDFVAESSQVDVACRLGFYGSTARGMVWCDDFELEHVQLRSAF